jgi:orotidine-5'-phosphate decarboxylase
MNIVEKYEQRVQAVNSLVCVGLDTDYDRIPARFQKQDSPQFAYNQWIIDQTHAYVSAYKPNMAFYEARGDQGLRELKLTTDYLRDHHPNILTICDAKRADIRSTNMGYVRAIFDWLGFDAVTLQPYLGREALEPFLSRKDKASIILCRTSNPGANEMQNLIIGGKPLWQVVAEKVRDEWNIHQNCMLVAGATYPEELCQIRAIVGDMTLLIPGVGAQGGNLEEIMTVGLNSKSSGMIVNSSRGIIFASNPAEAADNLRNAINQFR